MNFWLFNSKNPSKLFRSLARCVDYLLLFIVGGTVCQFLPYFIEFYYYIIFAALVPLIWIPIEALLISLTGTTPGKALFGIKILDPLGRKISYRESFKTAARMGWKNRESLKETAQTGARRAVIRQISLSFHRRLAALAIIVVCMVMSIFGDTITRWTLGFERGISNTGWTQYANEDGGFKVHLPNDPEEESQQVEIPKANKVLTLQELKSDQNNKIFYSVTFMELPRKWKIAGATRLLKAGLDILVKHTPDATLVDKEFTSHQGYRSLDFSMKQGENEVKGRLILAGTTLYKLTVTYPLSLEKEVQEDNPFLNSFDLSNK